MNRLTELLGVRLPIVQAPMGGATTPELVAAVSEAGALGSLAGAMTSPDALRAAVRRVRELTSRPFAVNLFAPVERAEPAPDVVEAVDRALAPFRRELGLPDPVREHPLVPPDPFEERLAVVVEENVPAFSFTFGIPPLAGVQESGAVIMGTATTADEAAALEEAGVHAVVAQGGEAGGHRGSFAVPFEQALVGTIALVPQVVDRVSVPVVAAGGIADGRGVAAALALGADGAQIGTAFLACPESGIPDAYRRAVLTAAETATVVTGAGCGRHARMIRTRLLSALENAGAGPAPYPAQGLLQLDLRAAGAEQGRADLLFLLAGQAAGLSRRLPAAELVARLAAECENALRRASA
jgi:nitronate monooxygenase